MIERIFDGFLTWIKRAKYFYLRTRIKQRIKNGKESFHATEHPQNLEIYFNPNFVPSVTEWGQGSAWLEIQYLLTNCHGKILDIACGPFTIYPTLSRLKHCQFYGCDISDVLISLATKYGVPADHLLVCDATQMPYEDNFFNFSYSIGSLEHFTEEGILKFLKECSRTTRQKSFHQIPTSRSQQNEGWITLDQSYFNNSVEWWLNKFQAVYQEVLVLDSQWEDPISTGKWFICTNSHS